MYTIVNDSTKYMPKWDSCPALDPTYNYSQLDRIIVGHVDRLDIAKSFCEERNADTIVQTKGRLYRWFPIQEGK